MATLAARMAALAAAGREAVVCGDWNIAHTEHDIKNWKGNVKKSGFLPSERAWLTDLLASGWVDVVRVLHPGCARPVRVVVLARAGVRQRRGLAHRLSLATQLAAPSTAALAARARIARGSNAPRHTRCAGPTMPRSLSNTAGVTRAPTVRVSQ